MDLNYTQVIKNLDGDLVTIEAQIDKYDLVLKMNPDNPLVAGLIEDFEREYKSIKELRDIYEELLIKEESKVT